MQPDPQVTRAEFEALKAELAELKLSRTQKAIRTFKRNKRLALGIATAFVFIPLSLYALSITKSFTFTAGNPTVASEVNANFDQLFTKVNDLAAYHPPIGTILAWHKSFTGTPILPASGEWVECNGQTLGAIGSVYDGLTIPNLNGAGAGADSPGQPPGTKVAMFLRGGLTSGTGQQDAFQGHWHEAHGSGSGSGQGVIDYNTRPSPTTFLLDSGTVKNPTTDGTNGTPRTATETRPVNMSVVWIMKVK